MSVKDERKKVLEMIYKEMGRHSNYSYPKELADIIKTLEAAEAAEREFELKELDAEVNNANTERDFDLREQEFDLKERELELRKELAAAESTNAQLARELENTIKLRELITHACITIGQAALWGAIFVHELKATRLFEVEGTETSAAGKWLKNSFPKVRLF